MLELFWRRRSESNASNRGQGMSKAGKRLLEAVDEIADWKAGKTKGMVIVEGERFHWTIGEYDAFRVGLRVGSSRANLADANSKSLLQRTQSKET